ncbi:MAG: nucleoside deaminase [Candidatus Margulisbacteria bacterium]|nr:nucleoside deaminase [Candidatus Margulisiibacteriota bacterium]
MNDVFGLILALAEAKKAAAMGEVPVGAVLVRSGVVVASGFNQKERLKDVLGHAEIQVISEASRVLGDWRLNGTTLYTTLEPCPMCAGVILHSRIARVVFGAWDLKWGAAGSVVNLFVPKQFNHVTEIVYVPMEKCEEILRVFFRKRRG